MDCIIFIFIIFFGLLQPKLNAIIHWSQRDVFLVQGKISSQTKGETI